MWNAGERCLHDTAGRLTQGVVEVVKRGVSMLTVWRRVCDETVGVLGVSEECERARRVDYLGRSYVNAIRCHAACPALPSNTTFPACLT